MTGQKLSRSEVAVTQGRGHPRLAKEVSRNGQGGNTSSCSVEKHLCQARGAAAAGTDGLRGQVTFRSSGVGVP